MGQEFALSMPQGAEWLIIGLIVLLLFGAKRLPDAARGLGRSMRILKSETKGLQDESEETVALPEASADATTTTSSAEEADREPVDSPKEA